MRARPSFRPGIEELERRETVADLLAALGIVAAAPSEAASEQAFPTLF
jgi:hypothetical protein